MISCTFLPERVSLFPPRDQELVVRYLRTEKILFPALPPPSGCVASRDVWLAVGSWDPDRTALVFTSHAGKSATADILRDVSAEGFACWSRQLVDTVLRIHPHVTPVSRGSLVEIGSRRNSVGTIGSLLRSVLHVVYGGVCQLCRRPTPFEDAQIEHIFPTSKSLETVRRELLARGCGANMLDDFLGTYWPSSANDLKNLTLACAECNRRKSDRLLSPLAAEMLLVQAVRRAPQVSARMRSRI